VALVAAPWFEVPPVGYGGIEASAPSWPEAWSAVAMR